MKFIFENKSFDNIEITTSTITDIVKELNKYLEENKLFAELDDYRVGNKDKFIIRYYVEWGDWKHEHLRLDYLVKTWAEENLSEFTVEANRWATEENGSDCYCGIHSYYFERK